MRNFVEPASYHDVLRDWRGATAMVWSFEATFRRLVLRLRRREQSGPDLYIGIVGCLYYRGPFNWDAACLEIADSERLSGDGANFIVRDRIAGVEIRSSSVVLFLDEDFYSPSNRCPDTDDGGRGA